MLQRERLSEPQLAEAGRALGGCLEAGHIVLLRGSMGAGKTTLTRAIAAGLGVLRPDRVCSPTFNICLIHDGPIPLMHADLFRLGETEVASPGFEALGLGPLADALAGQLSDAVLVVEWAELWADPPPDHLEIELGRPPGVWDHRELRCRGRGARHERLVRAWAAVCGDAHA